jgi:hypothetical protein
MIMEKRYGNGLHVGLMDRVISLIGEPLMLLAGRKFLFTQNLNESNETTTIKPI